MSETRSAWCLRCDGPQEADDRGCVVCAAIAEKKRDQMREIHRARKLTGNCINGRSHAQPSLKPSGERYTRCDDCRLVHRYGGEAVRRGA